MPPYNAQAERESLWYLKYDDAQASRALSHGRPQGVHAMTFNAFEQAYTLFAETLGGTPKMRVPIRNNPVPLHIHLFHYVVWNMGGFIQIEKTGRWSAVTKQMGLNIANSEPHPGLCHFVANTFKTSGLAQFEAWYTISIWTGKFTPVNGKEIDLPLPSPDVSDDYVKMVPIWCDNTLVSRKKEAEKGMALACYLRDILVNNAKPGAPIDRYMAKLKALSHALERMRLNLRQVDAVLQMSLSAEAELRAFGVPEDTLTFLENHTEAIQELRANYEVSLACAATASSSAQVAAS